MKRIITLITLAGVALPALAQQQVTSVDSSPAKAFFATEEWNKALMGSYGVNPGIEPGVPESEQERAVLGQIRDMLQGGSAATFRGAVQTIETLISEQRAAGETTSPMMLQIAGTLEMRRAEDVQNEEERKRILRQAESYLKQAIDPNTGFPRFLRAHKNLANLLFRMDRSKEAKQHFIKAIELGDRDAVTFGLLGAIFMDEGKLISSETALRNSLMINPNILEFKQLLGNVLLQQERYNEASDLFAELLQRRPNEVNFWMAQSNAYIALDRIDEAARNLEIVRFMGKANVPSLMLLGDVYINKEMLDEATEVYMDAIAMDPSTTYLNDFIGAAETLNNFAAYEDAMRVINNVEEQFSADTFDEDQEIDLLSLKSEINISLGQGEAAAANLEALLRKDPFNARALLTLARYYSDLEPETDDDIQYATQKRRNEQQAIIYYERAQELDDEMDRVRAYIGEAQLRVQRDELAESADLLEQAQAVRYQDNVQAYLNQINEALRNRRR